MKPTRRAFTIMAGGALATAGAGTLHAEGPDDVDLQLALAVDASGSVNAYRFELQKSGYVAAFRDPQVLKAITSGMLGSIAVMMYQWTGPRMHVVTAPWTKIDNRESCERFAGMIDAAPRRLFGGGTSIAGALDYGVGVFTDSGFRSTRRVIDVSGDGANTSGRPVSRARDDAVAAGVVVNGLPILSLEFDLDEHYKNEVIGGPGAFLVPAKSFEVFADAVRRKLIQEIAGAGFASAG
ncbi:MAG: DUF1194 domain-containing protein [Beijerinckiaceae bacterium]|nr:DUF1194 domain-containing protein [Beijerinckiaceae bacterium]